MQCGFTVTYQDGFLSQIHCTLASLPRPFASFSVLSTLHLNPVHGLVNLIFLQYQFGTQLPNLICVFILQQIDSLIETMDPDDSGHISFSMFRQGVESFIAGTCTCMYICIHVVQGVSYSLYSLARLYPYTCTLYLSPLHRPSTQYLPHFFQSLLWR